MASRLGHKLAISSAKKNPRAAPFAYITRPEPNTYSISFPAAGLTYIVLLSVLLSQINLPKSGIMRISYLRKMSLINLNFWQSPLFKWIFTSMFVCITLYLLLFSLSLYVLYALCCNAANSRSKKRQLCLSRPACLESACLSGNLSWIVD